MPENTGRPEHLGGQRAESCHVREKGGSALSDSDRDFPWWRWFAAFWGVLAIVGAALRAWGTLGLAVTFLTGFLAQELRSRQRREPRAGAPLLVALSGLTAALGAAGIYLLLRYLFHVSPAWGVVLLVFGGLFGLYGAGPLMARAMRARSARSPASD